MKKRLLSNLKVIISLLVGILLVFLWLKFIDVSEMVSYFSKIKIIWVIVAALFYMAAYLVRSLRWKIILRPVQEISLKESFIIFMAGMLINYIIPIRAGEIAKGFFLKGYKGTHVSKSLPTVFIDKMMDLFPIVILLLLLPFVPIKLNGYLIWGISIILFIFLILVGVIIFSLFNKKHAQKFLRIWFFWLPNKWKNKVNSFLDSFVSGIEIIKENKRSGITILLLTILAVILDSMYIIFMFLAFGYKIGFLITLFGYTLINLSYILPTPPAQIGSNEAIYFVIFSFAFGIDKNLVGASLGFAHLLSGSLIFLVGFIALNLMNVGFKKAMAISSYNSSS